MRSPSLRSPFDRPVLSLSKVSGRTVNLSSSRNDAAEGPDLAQASAPSVMIGHTIAGSHAVQRENGATYLRTASINGTSLPKGIRKVHVHRFLPRMDLNPDQRGIIVSASTLLLRHMDMDRESAGGVGGERHLRGRSGLELLLDVVAVQMQHAGLVRAPPQLDDVALLDPDHSHVLRQPPALDAQIEGDFGGCHDAGRH
jgi:hypothetical protein